MTDNTEIIRQFLSPEEPFGPVDAGEITDTKALEIIFERDNKIFRTLRQRASIIIGRKGSGKTSYLKSVCFDPNYTYVVSLKTSEALSRVIRSISLLTDTEVFCESVTDLWKTVIYIGLFGEIRHKLPITSRSKSLINDYLAKIGLRDGGTIDDILWKIAEIISERAKDKNHGILAEVIKVFDAVSFKLILETLEAELKRKNRRAVILLDSLDDFKLHIDVVADAIQGLLKFIGETNLPAARIDVRFCLPAELYHQFISLSTNPNKDFKRKVILHWTAAELVSLATHRLILFGKVHEDHPLSISYELKSIDHGHSPKVLKKILPTKVTCGLGVEEDPIAYILRHTQLLPRHLLIILNSICNMSRKYPGTQSTKLSEEALRKGVSAVEATLVQEIFVAYKSVYPNAEAVCKACIPELQHKFSIGDLERVFRREGKKTMGSDEFASFKRMLIEMGIIGRVTNDQDRYIQAQFEYTVPHQLVTSKDDVLCIHPLFTEIFAAKTTHDGRPVYPYGAQIEDSDYRGDDT